MPGLQGLPILRCAVCGRPKTNGRIYPTCSIRCGVAYIKQRFGPDWHRANGHQAGLASARVTKRQRNEQWRAQWPGVDLAMLDAVYDRGYNAGHRTGRRVGFAVGWDACVESLERVA